MEDRILNLPKIPKWWNKHTTIMFIVVLSIILHAWSVWQLPVDYDEPVYLEVASDYAGFIKQGDLQGLMHYEENQEHPAMVKVFYSIPYLLTEKSSDSSFYLFAARSISAFFGVLAVFFVALINPWAGFFLTLHSMTLKYTSQAYLEAVPLFAMVFSVYALLRSENHGKRWFYLSAISLGVIAASKYPYLFIIVVLGYLWFQFPEKNKFDALKFIFVSGVTFFILNPSIWADPVNRIFSSLFFHGLYSQSTHVQSYAYPWYQPLIYISTSVQWHPQVFFFFTSDELVFYVTIFGLYFEIKEKKWTAIWFFVGLLLLLIWPTKWPQYTLILSPVLSIIAGRTLQRGWRWLKPQDDYWNYLDAMLPKPPKITWWIIGIFILVLFGGKVGYEYQLALARRGWNSYDMNNSPLVSNVIYQINTGKEQEILFATEKGLQIWKSNVDSLWGESVTFFDQSNSPIPSNRITSVSYNKNNQTYWVGTDKGIVRFDGTDWEIFNQNSVGCEQCQVNDIAIDSSNFVWVGMNDGIYFYDGSLWKKLYDPEGKTTNEAINSLVRQKSSGIDKLWLGTYQGVSVYDMLENSWTHYIWADNFFGWGGVVDVNILKDGRVIANTSGGGIGVYQDEWTFYKNSNSPFKSNTVNTSIQGQDGSIWFGFGYPTKPGGYLMRLDPENEWHRYAANTSGYLEGEPLDLFFDDEGRLWVATNGNGIQTFYRQSKNGGRK